MFPSACVAQAAAGEPVVGEPAPGAAEGALAVLPASGRAGAEEPAGRAVSAGAAVLVGALVLVQPATTAQATTIADAAADDRRRLPARCTPRL
jgi:hypothetical protein